jgi:LacI family transcriptional regulator
MAKATKVTIEDISRHTGLSRGTVSRALNDRPDISIQTKQRVLEACRTLNYSPSHAARSLATGRSYAVAVLLDDLRSSFAHTLLSGVLARAWQARYAVHVAELGRAGAQAEELIRAVVNERIDCALLAEPLEAHLLPVLRQALEDRPAASCAVLDGVRCDAFVPDQRESGRLVARHLAHYAGSALLYVHAPERPGALERLAGFQEVCRERGLPPDDLVFELTEERPLPDATFCALSQRLQDARAVAATDDFLALELGGWCAHAGRRPGQDLVLMGQGNEPAGARVTPRLTTTDFCGREIGRRALEAALARLDKTRMDAPQTTCVPPMLVVRDSTAPVG